MYEALRHTPPQNGVGELGLAELALGDGDRKSAWAPLLAALRLRPADPGVRRALHAMVAQGLPQQQLEQIVEILFEDPARVAAFGRGDGALLLASLLEKIGHLPGAREALGHGEATSLPAAAGRHRRTLLLAVGDVAGFLADLREALPELVRDESNQVRGRWLRVVDGGWADGKDPVAVPERAHELCTALAQCGLIAEAEQTATLALLRAPNHQPLTVLRDQLRRELAFEGAVRRILYQGYDGSGASLDDVIEQLRGLSRRVLGTDVVGTPDRFSVPMVGELLDPFTGALAEHLAQYNRHLVVGRRWAGTVEGLLVTRLSVRELPRDGPLPLAGRCVEIVGEDRQIRPLTGVLGGDLAGVALLDHYVIDFDAVRDWAGSILERRRILREDGQKLRDDPLPELADPLDPVDVSWRLALLSPLEDSQVEGAVFDIIAAHERKHLVDSFYYLPPAANLWRVLGLAFAHGFSPLSIESDMEGRAEAGALGASEHTELVLAHIAGFLETDSEESPHAIGFRRLAERINEALRADPASADDARVSRWHLVPKATMQAIGRTLTSEW